MSFSVGLDLGTPTAPVPILFDQGNLVTLDVQADGSNLMLPVSFGKVGLFVVGGQAYVNGGGQAGSTSPATYTLGLAGDQGGANPFDGNLFANSSVSLAGTAGVSLPISLTPTTPPAQPPVTITINSLAGVLDGVAGSVDKVLAPDLNQDYALIQLIQDTPDLTSGLNEYLLGFQKLLNTQVFDNNYPVVGDQLAVGGQFLERFRVGLINQINNDSQGSNPIALIQFTLADIFGPGTSDDPGLGWLVDANGNRATTQAEALEDVLIASTGTTPPPSITPPASEYVNWSLRLDQSLTSVKSPVQFDVGLPGLEMAFPLDSSQPGLNTIQLGTGFDLFFNFGVNLDDGFYVDTTDHTPLSILVQATPVPAASPGGPSFAPLSGTYGYFGVSATPDVIPSKSGNPTEFAGTFQVGVADAASPGSNFLPYQDLAAGRLQISPTLQATGEVDLSLETSKFGISTVFDMQWDFATTDPDLSGGQPVVTYRQIGTSWAKSIADFLGPNLGRVFNFLDEGTLGDILDFIEKPLPVVDYFVGNANTIDFLGLLAAAAGQPAAYPLIVGFFDVVEFLRAVYRAVPSAFDPQYNLSIDRGSFTINQDLRAITSLAQIDTSKLAIDNSGVTPFIDQIFAYESAPKNKNFTTDEDGGTISGKLTNQLAIGIQNASLTLPYFEDPDTVKLMLLGRPGDLIRLITPSLGVYLQGQISFPVFTVDGVDINIVAGGSFLPSIQFGFGYDTSGLTDASQSGNIDDLKNGFFFIADQTFLDLQAKVYLGVGVGIPDVVSVSVVGDLLWNSNFALKSETGDDKVHLDDFDGLTLNGSLQLGGQIIVKFLFFKKTINIYKPVTLFDYSDQAADPDPTLARVDGGVLRLNIGPDAKSRQVGDTADGDEAFTIRHVGGIRGDEDLEVSAFGVTQTYHGVRDRRRRRVLATIRSSSIRASWPMPNWPAALATMKWPMRARDRPQSAAGRAMTRSPAG